MTRHETYPWTMATIEVDDSGETDREPATSRHRLAARVREIRRMRSLTIQEVSERSGLAISTVSKIERGLMAPTYDRFTRLAEGLGIDVAELFVAKGERFGVGEFALARVGECDTYTTENYTYDMLFSQLHGKAMVPMLGTLKPLEQMRFDRVVRHDGEEFLFVLEGDVIVQLEGRDPIRLATGDSIYFDSRRGHLYASAGDRPARILVVCTKLGVSGADQEGSATPLPAR